MTRKEAIQVLNMVEAHGSIVIQAKEMAIKALEQEPKTGHWIKLNVGYGCSECSLATNEYGKNDYKYCPNCGAKMERGE